MEEKMEYLRRIFGLAQARGLCRTQKEFADLLGINDKGLSAAINGNAKFLTDSLVRKVEMFSFREGLEMERQAPKKRETMEIPVDFKQMLDNMSEVLDWLFLDNERTQTARNRPAGTPTGPPF